MKILRAQVFSDIACPWCYVGKRRLEAAVSRLPPQVRVEVTWRSFELDPSAPRLRPEDGSYAERLARKYGSSVAEAQAMIDRMTSVAAGEGLAFRFDRIRPGNTFDAHRLVHLGKARGRQDAVKERLFRGYLAEGEPIGDRAALARLAAEAGLEPEEVGPVLEGDAFAADVRADEAEAAALGIHAVPFFVLEGRYGISGAQPVEVMERALATALAEVPEAEEAPQGESCGPDGCG